jgi:hypothetical protein
MTNAQAELIDSVPPVIEAGIAPPDQDRVSLSDPNIAAGLVSDFRQDIIVHTALENLIESSFFQHGPTAATAHHAASIALQRVRFHSIRSMPEATAKEVPVDIDPHPSKSKAIFYFCAESTKKMREDARKEKYERGMLHTGEQNAPADPTDDAAMSDAEKWLALINDTSHLSGRQKMTRRIRRFFMQPAGRKDYYLETAQIREEQMSYLATEERDTLPGYTHEELDVIYQALVGLLNSNPAERFELLAPDEDKKPTMTAFEKTEINAVLSLLNNHRVEEVASIHELVGQRGRTGAYKAVASGKMVQLTTAAGEKILLPIDPLLDRNSVQ